jgi:hypothetical protein
LSNTNPTKTGGDSKRSHTITMINDNINMDSAIARSTNIFLMLGGHVFQQTIGIPTSTNCASLLTDLFLYSYEAD